MQVIDLVEGINQYFTDKYPNKGFFISIHRIKTNPTVRALETHTLELWYKNSKYKELVFTTDLTFNTSKNTNIVSKELSSNFIKELLNNFNKIEQYGIQ